MPTIDPNVIESGSHFMALIILLAIGLFLIWLVTIIDIVKSDFNRDADKIVWFFFVMLLAPIGIVLYFFIGRFQKTDAEPVLRSTRYRDIGRD
jgi:hypothetical protein